jgi:hypothetical protein
VRVGFGLFKAQLLCPEDFSSEKARQAVESDTKCALDGWIDRIPSLFFHIDLTPLYFVV